MRPTPAGMRPRVASETPTITAKAVGTDQAAGWASSAAGQPRSTTPDRVARTAVADSPPPTTRPAAAPGAVSPRHQIPSTSRGQKVEAAIAKASPTTCPTGRLVAASASSSGTTAATTLARRKSRTVPRSTSCTSTPAVDTSSPDEVDRKAAKAPATSRACSSSPSRPPTIAAGRARTTASVRPVISSSGAYSLPNAP